MVAKSVRLSSSAKLAILAVAAISASSKNGPIGQHVRDDVNTVPTQLLDDPCELAMSTAIQ
jgi:hypothetical protein